MGTGISRRSALRVLGGASLGLAGIPDSHSGAPQLARNAQAGPLRLQEDTRPNIVLIVADDMRADDLVDMPATSALLVSQGMRFDQFFASVPSCAPSRASILRGQYPQNHGVLRGGEQEWGFGLFHELGRETSTVATWLHNAGYRTALFGKYLNNYPSGADPDFVPPGWDEWAGVTGGGYEKFELNENGVRVSYKDPENFYETDLLSAKATDFVSRTAQSGNPFFLYLAPRATHAKPVPAARHKGAFASEPPYRPPSFNERGIETSRWAQELPELNGDEIAKIDAIYRARKETLLALDELVADLVAALELTGALDNTYVVFTSDNGYHLGEHRISSGKGTAYEEAIRVPLVIRGPGVPAGGVSMAVSSVIDLAPTFATWAGVDVPSFVDGRALEPVILGDLDGWRQAVLVQLHRDNPDKVDGPPAFEALRGDAFV